MKLPVVKEASIISQQNIKAPYVSISLLISWI